MRCRVAVMGVAVLLMVGTSWCIGLATVRINLPDMTGSVFAVEVIEFKLARPEDCNWAEETARAVLGLPPETVRNDTAEGIPLGEEGFVVVRMGSPFTNGDDVDLRVYATPHQGYGLYNVSVSADAETWVEVANRVRSDKTNVWYKSIDFGSLEGTFEYVRIDAIKGTGGGCSPYIYAVEARHPCEAAPPPQPPRARFTYAPSEVKIDLSITFSASSSTDADGEIVSYSWNFGDGTSGTGRTVSHAFSRSGTFTVRLEVTDSDGLSASTSQMIRIAEAQSPPTAEYSHTLAGGMAGDPPATYLPGDVISFDASPSTDPDGRIVEYAWDWDGDSEFDELSHQPNAEHTFDAPGTYLVTLRVLDNSGLTTLETKTIEIVEPPVAEQVAVSITSTPSGADVEIDGYFVGNTPLELMLDIGAIYEIRMILSGYEEWVRTIKVFEGLAINVTLTAEEGG